MRIRRDKYTLRKTTVGLVSVMMAGGFLLMSHSAKAAELGADKTVQAKDNHANIQEDQAENNQAVQASAGTVVNSDTEAINLNISTNQSDQAEDKQTELVPAKPSQSGMANGDTKNPINYQGSQEQAEKKQDVIYQGQNIGEAATYFTFKGLDGKTYVTPYATSGLSTEIDLNSIDRNSIELHIFYQDNGQGGNPGLMITWNNRINQLYQPGQNWQANLAVDDSRLVDGKFQMKSQSGNDYSYQVGTYGNVEDINDFIKAGKDITKTGTIYMHSNVAADDKFDLTIPLIYVGQSNDKNKLVDTYYDVYTPHSSENSYKFVERHIENIEPAKPSESGSYYVDDPDPVYYQGDQADAEKWQDVIYSGQNIGEAATYYTFKGLDGKTYVTPYIASGLNTQIDLSAIDPDSIELHIFYKDNGKGGNPGLMVTWDNGKDKFFAPNAGWNANLTVDGSRLVNGKFQIKSKYGNQYSYEVGTYGNVKNVAEFLKNGGDITKTGTIYMHDTINAWDMIDMIIPLKYVGQANDKNNLISTYYDVWTARESRGNYTFIKPSMTSDQIDDYLALGTIDEQGNWIFNQKLSDLVNQAGINGKNSYQITLPNGQVVDFTRAVKLFLQNEIYRLLLDKIEQVISQYGYTVEFDSTSQNPAQSYAYRLTLGYPAKDQNGDTLVFIDGKATKLKDLAPDQQAKLYNIVSIVPVITFGKDEISLDQTDSSKIWDPYQTGTDQALINHLYQTSDAVIGKALPASQLKDLPVNGDNLQVEYYYQAQKGDGEVVKVDQIDTAKSGYYTVVYSVMNGSQKISKTAHVLVVAKAKPVDPDNQPTGNTDQTPTTPTDNTSSNTSAPDVTDDTTADTENLVIDNSQDQPADANHPASQGPKQPSQDEDEVTTEVSHTTFKDDQAKKVKQAKAATHQSQAKLVKLATAKTVANSSASVKEQTLPETGDKDNWAVVFLGAVLSLLGLSGLATKRQKD